MITHQFAYTPIQGVAGVTWNMPFVTLSLTYQKQMIAVPALVDSGSALNILPYDYGLLSFKNLTSSFQECSRCLKLGRKGH